MEKSFFEKAVCYFFFFKNSYCHELETTDCEIRFVVSFGETFVMYVPHTVIGHLMQSGTVVSGYQRFLNYFQKTPRIQVEFRLLEEQGRKVAVPLKQSVSVPKSEITRILTKDRTVRFKLEKIAYSFREHVSYPTTGFISTAGPQQHYAAEQSQPQYEPAVPAADQYQASDDMLDYQSYIGR
ncbi:MAG: hypothetical protein HRU09_13800 [Oligoflexales bacterium]|nr:hypothetical protein [Oligoflexales bacterium]